MNKKKRTMIDQTTISTAWYIKGLREAGKFEVRTTS